MQIQILYPSNDLILVPPVFFFNSQSFEVDFRESICASDHCVTRVDQWLLRLDLGENPNGRWLVHCERTARRTRTTTAATTTTTTTTTAMILL